MTDNVLVCVNLIDEAERKGIEIDLDKLSDELGVQVISVVARQKKSVKSLLECLGTSACNKKVVINYPTVVEECVDVLKECLIKYNFPFSERWLAINLLTNREEITNKIKQYFNVDLLSDEQVVLSLKSVDEI